MPQKSGTRLNCNDLSHNRIKKVQTKELQWCRNLRKWKSSWRLNSHDWFLFSAFAGRNPQIQNSNLARECIRHFFPKRKCFTFDRPTKEKELLVHIEDVAEDQLDPNFQVQSENFCSYIFTCANPKILKDGIHVTGKRESSLLQSTALFYSCSCEVKIWLFSGLVSNIFCS